MFMSEYMEVYWIHQSEDEPVWLYSELDTQRLEKRKIDIYKDESFGIAGAGMEFGGTILSAEAVPNIEDINKDKEFIAKPISREKFEELWNHYTTFLK